MKLLPKNILAIEDSLTLRKFLEKSLAQEDCVNRLLLAPDAKTGIEMAQQSKPDLILCDYTLPDMLGDELCQKLFENPDTSHIPIIMMSSSGREMSSLALNQTNVVRMLVKPFSCELLVATISYVLNHWEEKKSTAESAKAVGAILMRGSTDASSMCSALRFISQKEWTGVLRVIVRGETVHAFCEKGSVRVVTTRKVETYLEGTPYLTKGKKSPIWKKCEDLHRETLSPFLYNLSMEGVLPTQTARTLTDLYGHRLFSRVWTEKGINYEFEETSMPPFVAWCRPSHELMNDWILENLRNVDAAEDIQAILEDPLGVPVFTASGYRQMQEVRPQEDEWKVLTQINGGTSMKEICIRLQSTPDLVARKIFCYQRLGFLDYWPSYIFQPQN